MISGPDQVAVAALVVILVVVASPGANPDYNTPCTLCHALRSPRRNHLTLENEPGVCPLCQTERTAQGHSSGRGVLVTMAKAVRVVALPHEERRDIMTLSESLSDSLAFLRGGRMPCLCAWELGNSWSRGH